MVESFRRTMAQYPDKVTKSEYLELAKKDERRVPRSTGVHIVTFLRAEPFTKNDDYHSNVEGFNLFFDEDGIEKKYFIPTYVKDRNSPNYGKFYYLYQKFADIEEDTMLELEYIKKGARGYVDVRPYVRPGDRSPSEDIPVIDENTYGQPKKGVNPEIQEKRNRGKSEMIAAEEEYDNRPFEEKLKD